jgi:hypothetical protein
MATSLHVIEFSSYARFSRRALLTVKLLRETSGLEVDARSPRMELFQRSAGTRDRDAPRESEYGTSATPGMSRLSGHRSADCSSSDSTERPLVGTAAIQA